MTTEPCTFRGRGSDSGPAEAEIARYAVRTRVLRSTGIAAFGLMVGAAMLPIPGLHLVSWVVPVATLGVGAYLWTVRIRLDRVSGPCPKCGGAVEAAGLGLVGGDEIWIACPSCKAPIVVEIERG